MTCNKSFHIIFTIENQLASDIVELKCFWIKFKTSTVNEENQRRSFYLKLIQLSTPVFISISCVAIVVTGFVAAISFVLVFRNSLFVDLDQIFFNIAYEQI